MAAFFGHVFRVDSTRNLFSLERGHVPFQQWIFFLFSSSLLFLFSIRRKINLLNISDIVRKSLLLRLVIRGV